MGKGRKPVDQFHTASTYSSPNFILKKKKKNVENIKKFNNKLS